MSESGDRTPARDIEIFLKQDRISGTTAAAAWHLKQECDGETAAFRSLLWTVEL